MQTAPAAVPAPASTFTEAIAEIVHRGLRPARHARRELAAEIVDLAARASGAEIALLLVLQIELGTATVEHVYDVAGERVVARAPFALDAWEWIGEQLAVADDALTFDVHDLPAGSAEREIAAGAGLARVLAVPVRTRASFRHALLAGWRRAGVPDGAELSRLFSVAGDVLAALDERELLEAELGAAHGSRDSVERARGAELAAQSARVGALLDALPDAVFELDARLRHVAYHVPNVAMMVAPPERLLGRAVTELLPPDAATAVLDALQTSATTGQVEVAEYWVDLPVGRRFMECRVCCLGSTYLMVMRDRTDERRRTRELEERTAELSRANAELLRASRAKDNFLATMSHELRTPLNPILGIAESMREEVYGPINDRQRKALDNIEQSGAHLLQLLGDILDIAKLEADHDDLVLVPVEVGSAFRDALAIIEAKARAAALAVDVDFGPPGVRVIGDARRIRQVALNLLSNAVKFTPPGGRVGVRVAVDASRGEVDIDVWDTGVGIRASDRGKLFQPFVQLDSGLDRKRQGTGLGLALVARFVRRMNGRIELQSTPGNGSTFTVVLPLAPVVADADRPA